MTPRALESLAPSTQVARMNRRPDAATIKARRAEIRRRYARGKPKFSWIARRIRDLEDVYRDHYGAAQLADDDNGRDLARIMAHHLAQAGGDPRPYIAEWLQSWAPWLSIAAAREITTDAIMRPQRWKADRLAWRLKLTDADRTRLQITTIGAVDVSREERAARRAQRKYNRRQIRRRRAGMRPRAEYLAASITRAKPWVELGISRAAWYRAGKPQPA